MQAWNGDFAAILAADVVDYSRLAGADEDRTLARLRALRSDLIDPTIAVHSGRVVKRTGDGAIVEFRSVVNAVRCAIEIQSAMIERNAGVPDDRRIELRIGIHLGDVVEESDGDLMGDGVNIAARLEGVAAPGAICLSDDAYRQVKAKLNLSVSDLGDTKLKNIADPMRVYSLTVDGSLGTKSVADAEPSSELDKPSVADKPSIALLPFVNLSKDPEQDSLADGITENVIMGLSRFRDLSVIASNSSFAFKGKAVKVQDASKELGARYILEGNVQRSKDRVRITAQLIDGHTGRHLWAERYDRPLDDVFAVQDEVTERIIGSLATTWGGRLLKAWHERPERTGTRNSQAVDYIVRGMEAMEGFTHSDILRSRELFTRAGEIDPHFGKAFAKLAWTHLTEANEGWSDNPDASLENGLKYAKLAIERDDAEAWGYYALAGYYLYRRQLDRSIAAFERALELNPNDPDVLVDFGYALSYAGEPARGLEISLKGLRLNPYHPDWYLANLGQVYYDAGRYEEAIATLERVPDIDTVYIRMYLAASHIALDRQADAHKSIQRAIELDPDASIKKVTSPVMAPYKNAADLEKFREHLRKAGLPE